MMMRDLDTDPALVEVSSIYIEFRPIGNQNHPELLQLIFPRRLYLPPNDPIRVT
jgi:hypothetical protein